MDSNFDALVEALAREARTSGLESRIMTERELAERLGNSRATVRENLGSLEVLGMVRRTQGAGTFFTKPDASFVRLLFDLMSKFGHVDHASVERAREMMEIAVVQEAADRADHDDVAVLRGHIDAMVRATAADDAEAGHEADYAFHKKLFTIADNPVIELFVDGISLTLRDVLAEKRAQALRIEAAALPEGSDRPRRTDTIHTPIVDAIEAHDRSAAAAAMVEHFTLWRQITEHTGTPAEG
ncbi:FadR/GntR family transcriptional regulator [Nocardiopsis sp. MG754419]|uniref:FadR/GntR family transcriptional regulator n=1 Tax=Nocardiopsis sp. MG754419 TaxID=2259865 RepID=UPI001BA8A81F|nr:FCD domain-containing protein [Nocardiopsis sp. MG754419]MBR8740761.1 FadR family transcriptional regulator [Nocardiopsis sp. MG754419]